MAHTQSVERTQSARDASESPADANGSRADATESPADASPDPVLSLSDVTKDFGPETAVDGVSLDVEPGELLTFLGPSGCGKTTTLRLIAGFEEPTAGTIRFSGESVAGCLRRTGTWASSSRTTRCSRT